MSLPAFIAAIVGTIPIIPTTAVTTVCASGYTAASVSPSMPYTILTSRSAMLTASSFASCSSATLTSFGPNSLIWASSSFILLPAANATISISLFLRTTSSVCVPIDPVDPSTEIFFTSVSNPSSDYKIQHPVYYRCGKYHTVISVKYSAVSRYKPAVILNIFIALYC